MYPEKETLVKTKGRRESLIRLLEYWTMTILRREGKEDKTKQLDWTCLPHIQSEIQFHPESNLALLRILRNDCLGNLSFKGKKLFGIISELFHMYVFQESVQDGQISFSSEEFRLCVVCMTCEFLPQALMLVTTGIVVLILGPGFD